MTKLAPPGTLTALSSLFGDSKANVKPNRIKDNSPSHSLSLYHLSPLTLHFFQIHMSLLYTVCPHLPLIASLHFFLYYSFPPFMPHRRVITVISIITSQLLPPSTFIYSQGILLPLRLFFLFLELSCCWQLRCSILSLRHDRCHCPAGQTAAREFRSSGRC